MLDNTRSTDGGTVSQPQYPAREVVTPEDTCGESCRQSRTWKDRILIDLEFLHRHSASFNVATEHGHDDVRELSRERVVGRAHPPIVLEDAATTAER
jgi:hypothetical protein